MKIIQQNFKVNSKIGFFLSLIATILFILPYYFVDDNSILMKIIGIFGMVIIVASIYNTYIFSFTYEFKQNELITCSLFTFWKKRVYFFKNLKMVEYIINKQGTIDTIYLYFKDKSFKNRVEITMFQVDLGRVRLFLFANVENFETLIVEKERTWGR